MTSTRSNAAPPDDDPPRGVPIDRDPMPGWLTEINLLTPGQLAIEVGTRWITALRKSAKLGKAAKSIAGYLHQYTIGHRIKKAWPSYPLIMQETGIRSTATVSAGLDQLFADGWVLREVPNERRTPLRGRTGRSGCGYRLAWPLVECMSAAADSAPRCGALTGKERLCGRRAGWGTDHRGVGPCKLHDPALQGGAEVEQRRQAAPPAAPPPAPPASPVSPSAEGTDASRILQLVEHSQGPTPVDNPAKQLAIMAPLAPLANLNTSTIGTDYFNGWGSNASTVGANASTGEGECVRGSLSEFTNGITRGSGGLGAELEGARARPANETNESSGEVFADPAPEQLQRIEQAHEVLDGLSENMLGYYLSRGRLDLRKKGHLDPDPDELVLAAAAAVRRRTA